MQSATIMAGLMLFLVACGEEEAAVKQPPSPQPAVAKPQPPAKPVAEEEEERPVYVYSGDRFKDPFMEVGSASAYSPEAIFNPDQARVKGIIYSARLRSAVLQVTGSGSYFIKGSRIFDVMGKTLDGFSAKIFPEKVVISGEEDDVFELKIRETETDEEEKS